MSEIDDILKSVEDAWPGSAKREQFLDGCWNVIADSRSTNTQRATAYNYLGTFVSLMEPSFDGGHHGLGWYVAALIHDPDYLDAMSNIVSAYSCENSLFGHQDLALVRRCFDRLINDQSEVGVKFRERLKDPRYFRNLPRDWVQEL